ncbi:hypothetical protein GCM10010965_22260 [Caldalkalibacillus thermarum]|uniref:cell wall-binding repeat-containing protein n=1 Tax=Caldalkalibacillus thermarum TaxID=296745 RepID=UPI00166B0E54|nr:cell wall-binding repeat-containing protein [Caldalkalibacillus thermarum]GGK28968.1 hypothetical protein GCM10010965_22260 [Caldalkalibacillus thermarum]
MNKGIKLTVLVVVLVALLVEPFNAGAFDLESRIAGQNRYETSAMIAREVFMQSDTVIIARGDLNNDFADGLTASVLAGALDSPILLTHRNELHPAVAKTIQQMGAKQAYILGGEAAVSRRVEEQVASLVGQVKRIEGQTRFDTAANILREAGIKAKAALVVNGFQSADAMVAGAVAFKQQLPILPVHKDQIPDVTKQSINRLGLERVYLVGGQAVISPAVKQELTKLGLEVQRVAGENRFATSVQVANLFFERPTGLVVVNGHALADAVGAAVYGQPILYTQVDSLPEEVKEWVSTQTRQGRLGWKVVVGGEQVVDQSVRDTLRQMAEEAAGGDEGYWFRTTQFYHNTVELADYNYNNTIYVSSHFEPYPFQGELSWTENPYDSRTWQLYLHSLHHVSYLLDGYVLTGEHKYLAKAEWYIHSWRKHNADPRTAASTMAWHNHAAANRLITLTYFWQQWRHSPLYDPAVAEILVELMHSHASYLADDRNYSHYNHGIFQDKALLQFVTLFPWTDPHDTWRDKAISRLTERLKQDLTREGVHKEHSPNYHLLFYNQFKELERFVQSHGLPLVDLSEQLRLMERYLAYIAKPNGELPLLGDTRSMELARRMDAAEVDEQLAYVLTRGAQGRQPQALDVVYPEGGTAVFRNSWTFDNQIYMLLTAAFHSVIHKHADDLSFVLSHGWTDYFVDSGMYNFEEEDPFRQYLRSVFAHNTIAVGGESYALTNEQAGRSKITGYYLGETYSYVTAEHHLYPAVNIKRSIIHLKPNTFFILDRVKGYKTREVSQLFQIGPEVEIVDKSEAGLHLASRVDDSELFLHQLQPAERLEHYYGQTDPVRGWRSTELNELQPSHSVHFVQTAREAEFQTLFYINETNVVDVAVEGDGVRFMLDNGDTLEVDLNK